MRDVRPRSRRKEARKRVARALCAAVVVATMLAGASARAGERELIGPWTSRPLEFGMTPDQAAHALGVPLDYVRGRPGNELFLAVPNVKGALLAYRSDGLFLQFRHGHLSAWKGDWGTIRSTTLWGW
jgi:hypothetical protein